MNGDIQYLEERDSMGNNKRPKQPRSRLFVDLVTPVYKGLQLASRQNFRSMSSIVTEAIMVMLDKYGIQIEDLVDKD